MILQKRKATEKKNRIWKHIISEKIFSVVLLLISFDCSLNCVEWQRNIVWINIWIILKIQSFFSSVCEHLFKKIVGCHHYLFVCTGRQFRFFFCCFFLILNHCCLLYSFVWKCIILICDKLPTFNVYKMHHAVNVCGAIYMLTC